MIHVKYIQNMQYIIYYLELFHTPGPTNWKESGYEAFNLQ